MLHIYRSTSSLIFCNGLSLGMVRPPHGRNKPQDGAIVKLPRYLAAERGRIWSLRFPVFWWSLEGPVTLLQMVINGLEQPHHLPGLTDLEWSAGTSGAAGFEFHPWMGCHDDAFKHPWIVGTWGQALWSYSSLPPNLGLLWVRVGKETVMHHEKSGIEYTASKSSSRWKF